MLSNPIPLCPRDAEPKGLNAAPLVVGAQFFSFPHLLIRQCRLAFLRFLVALFYAHSLLSVMEIPHVLLVIVMVVFRLLSHRLSTSRFVLGRYGGRCRKEIEMQRQKVGKIEDERAAEKEGGDIDRRNLVFSRHQTYRLIYDGESLETSIIPNK